LRYRKKSASKKNAERGGIKEGKERWRVGGRDNKACKTMFAKSYRWRYEKSQGEKLLKRGETSKAGEGGVTSNQTLSKSGKTKKPEVGARISREDLRMPADGSKGLKNRQKVPGT